MNEKLEELTREVLSSERDNLSILGRIEDIRGLILTLYYDTGGRFPCALIEQLRRQQMDFIGQAPILERFRNEIINDKLGMHMLLPVKG